MERRAMKTPKLKRRTDGWWIVWGDSDDPDAGPYDTRAEANEDRDGLARTFKSREWKQVIADTERERRSVA
jgi:hypothetical protein